MTKPTMTAEDFLAWDRQEASKHEFVQGEVFLMAGAEAPHVQVTGNVYVALRMHLAGTPCRTFQQDMKLRVDEVDAFFYPDVLVTCSTTDISPQFKREPLLLVEVLSPSTAAYDRGEKFASYRAVPSLREYLMIDPATRRCDLFRRGQDGLWVLHPSLPGEAVYLQSVDLTIEAASLWAAVDVPPGIAAA